ncbi:MAG: prepilin peptidase [Gammaproteobacteria bacterium]|nr:prepilin peptidase [Gammaproteobacteria bacterium]
MDLFTTLSRIDPLLLLSAAGLIGLIVGSFLNVVIHRLPIMMENGWKEECRQLLHDAAEPTTPTESGEAQPLGFSLYSPPSHCPHCKAPIKPYQNIPIVSFLFQRGKCSACKVKISWRYPLVELLTALLTVVVVSHFGISLTTMAATLLTWGLIALTFIDFDTQLLPDDITLPLLWLGLLLTISHTFTDPVSGIVGAVMGYLIFWSVYQAFKLLTGKEGMGYGDFKLLAMLGAWFGWQSLPLIIIISAGAGAIIGTLLILFKNHERQIPIPFGPYLAIAGWLTMLWGETMNHYYLDWATGSG